MVNSRDKKILRRKIIFIFILLFNFQKADGQWTEQFSGDTVIFKSVSAVDNNIVWLCGDVQRVYLTTNGGTNWIRRSSTAFPYPLSLSNIFGINQNTALVTGTFSGDRTYVFRTSNGGVSWSQVFIQQFGFINSIWMTDSLNGFMMGDPVDSRWSLWRTTNGGNSWDSTALYLAESGNENGYSNSMYLRNDGILNHIWFGTNNFRIYYSSNSGLTWYSQITPTCEYIFSIWFNSSTNGMVGGSGIHFTTNGGQNWNLSSSMISNSGIVGEGNNWWTVQSYYSSILFSSDNGINWSTQFNDTSIQFTKLGISRNYLNQYSIWAVGNPGKILKHSGVVGIKQSSFLIPNEYFLSQNYPNPFNPITSIHFKLKKNQFVELNIYNLIGEEITNLISENLGAGEYTVNFNASNYSLSSGIYFYRIISEEFTSVKKMLLAK